MSIASLVLPLMREARRFRRDRGGNIAVIFAIALLPLLGFVGAAVDYSRASRARSAMQTALDSAALMVSKDYSQGAIKETDITTTAQKYFDSLYKNSDGISVQVTATYTPNTGKGSTIKLDASSAIKAEFMKVAGISKMQLGTSSTTTWGSTRLRVALVLDTTGSMSSAGKIDALKTATKSLLGQLRDAASKPEDVYVSIIPFAKNVNLDSSNYNADWIDWTDWQAEPAILDPTKGGRKPSNWASIGPGSSCPFTDGYWGEHGFTCTNIAATLPGARSANQIPSSGLICPSKDSGNKNRLKNGLYYNGCYNSIPTETKVTVASCWGVPNCTCTSGRNPTCTKTTTGAPYTHVWRPTGVDDATPAKSTWNGCVADRGTYSSPSNDYDRKVIAPIAGVPESQFPAEQTSYCTPVVTALNSNWANMTTAVDGLYPLGGTNQPIGLVWGWQSLVGGGPFPTPPTKDPNYTYQDIIVLMSDGLNTIDRWYGDGSTPSPDVDQRMYKSETVGTCANIKAADVKIFTVHVNTDGGPASTLLRNCASPSDTGEKEFQIVTSASGIQTAFDSIGTKLTKLRLAY
ncbi:pilus assembly protein TadG-related protein [Rhodopseudomonas parapalustris]